MKKIAISVLVLLAMLLVSCADSMETSDVLAARAAEGDIKWVDSFKGIAYNQIVPLKSDRNNASGKGVIKITSNAHSNAAPGIYFHWDSKQKDDGYLVVAETVFTEYEGFILTTKVSNTYWDYNISIFDGQEPTADGYYVYSIPKGKKSRSLQNGEWVYAEDKGCGKNINMVFIGNWKEVNKPISDIYGETVPVSEYTISFKKIVTDENFGEVPVELWIGDADKFSFQVLKGTEVVESGLKLDGNQTITTTVTSDGVYTIRETITGTDKYTDTEITVEPIEVKTTISLKSTGLKAKSGNDPKGSAYIVDNDFVLEGKVIQDLWKSMIDGFDGIFDDATFIWDRPDSYFYAVSGPAQVRYTTTISLSPAEKARIASFPVNFTADNAAALFVNGEYVAGNGAVYADKLPTIKDGFADFTSEGFHDNNWTALGFFDIADLLVAGDNEIVFIAANSDNMDKYDFSTNPCGLIFFGEAVIKTVGAGKVGVFENKKVLGAAGNGGGTSLKLGEVANASKYQVNPALSWFTYAELDKGILNAGKIQTIDFVDGNQGNKIYHVTGKAFIQVVNGDLKVTIDGRNVGYFASLMPVNDKNPNSWSNGSKTLNPFTMKWNGEDKIYLFINSGTFYKF